jgi:RimJ/RimL family protein N-acetyltransferase
VLHTSRLHLRQWRPDDLDAWAALNADPAVMEFLGPPMGRDQSAIWLGFNQAIIDSHGWGLWAVEVAGGAPFIGFVGLKAWDDHNLPGVHFTPCVEVGWRLAREHWGHGYAPEAAGAALDYGFDVLELDEIVSMTAVINTKSRRVMEKLGMTTHADDDFAHPRGTGDLGPHVLYRLRRPAA